MKNEEKKEIRYFSMFTGVGGFELGLERTNDLSKIKRNESGRNEENSSNIKQVRLAAKQFTCIGFSETDKYASELLKKKFPRVKNYGDATKIIPKELPNFNLLVGGFPCQAFSIAGKRKGFEDTRGTLFHEIVRILEVKRPEYLLLENVKGLLSHDRGRTFAIILASLSKLGYVIQWMVLNSKFFGVPQNRERVFIIGSLRTEPIPEILPFKFTNRENVKESGNEQERRSWISTLDSRYGQRWSSETYVRDIPQAQRIRTQTLQGQVEGQGAKTGLYNVTQLNPSNESGGKQPYQQNRIYDKEGISPALPSELGKDRSHLINTMKIRRLTPIECERLQSFPNNWTKGFSDTQRYKMMGNAVTVNVIKAIAEKL